jgi:hypothetical protein
MRGTKRIFATATTLKNPVMDETSVEKHVGLLLNLCGLRDFLTRPVISNFQFISPDADKILH